MFLNDIDGAVRWMAKAIEQRDPRAMWMEVHPWACDSPDLIDHFPFVPERERLAAAIGAVDHQIVVTANRAREHEAMDSGADQGISKPAGFQGVVQGHQQSFLRSGCHLVTYRTPKSQ